VSGPIDEVRLATAMVNAFRDEAKRHWPHLKGDGWPAYAEHHQTQTFLVSDIAAAVAREYDATPNAEVPDPSAEWNVAGMS
jgi:hypothetical protein